MDGQLTLATYISSVCHAGFFQLRQLRSVRRSLTTEATRALVQAFISCRLDYYNSLLPGSLMFIFHDSSLCRTRQPAVSGAHRHDHITPVLVGLHWLPVRQRIIYKTAVLVWKCLHDAAPRYLADLCVPRRLGLCWSRVPGLLPVSAATPSMADEHGAVCQPILEHQIRPSAPSSVISRPTCFCSSLRC